MLKLILLLLIMQALKSFILPKLFYVRRSHRGIANYSFLKRTKDLIFDNGQRIDAIKSSNRTIVSNESVADGINLNSCKRFKANEILALDFDGVICASSGESSFSAILAAKSKWPEIFNDPITLSLPAEEITVVQNCLRYVRPIIETGYENVLLARYFTELYREHSQNLSKELTKSWSHEVSKTILRLYNTSFREKLLEKYNSDKSSLVKAFGTTRDELIANDITSWLSLNEVYPHIPAIFSSNNLDLKRVFIITTKQERFVRAILNHFKLKLALDGESNSVIKSDNISPNSNIFDLENAYGPKLQVLKELSRRLSASSSEIPTIHFVEDRVETLLNLRRHYEQTGELSNVKLYLVDWGYNTEEQRDYMKKTSENITVIGAKEFGELVSNLRCD